MRRLFLLPIFAALLTCRDSTGPGNGGPPPGPAGIRSVALYPRSDSLLVGDTLRLQIFVTDSNFQTVAAPKVTWRSTDTNAITVDSTGLIRARLAGTAGVTATVAQVSGGAFVTAQWPVVTLLMPDSITITRYELVRFLPGLLGPTGTEVSDRPTTWTTSDSGVARVGPDGTVTPAGLGTVFIAAASGGFKDSTRLAIVHEQIRHLGMSYDLSLALLAGHPVPVDAFCSDSLFRDVTGVPITWVSGDTTLLTVTVSGNDREPTVHPLRAGSLVVRLACGPLRDSVPVSITFPATSVRFLPETVTVAIGQIVVPSAVFKDSTGGSHGFEEVTLQSLDTTVVGVSNVTSLVGRKAGQARVVGSALDANFTDTATVQVVGADNLRVSFSWFNYSLSLPNYSLLSGIILLRDTTGATPAVPHTITLTTSDTGVARISPASVNIQDNTTVSLAYGHPGVANIIARVDSLTFAVPVQSGSIPAARVSLSAARPPRVLQVGDTFQLVANVFGTDEGARFYPVAWTTSDPSRARVDTEGISFAQTARLGRLTALAPGTVVARASSGGFSDSVVMTIRSVLAPAIASASPALLVPGATVTFSGSGFDPNTANDSVWVEGIPAGVTGATATTLTAVLPAAGAFRCTPTHQAIVAIGVNGALGVDSMRLRVAFPESVTVGRVGRVPPGTGACVEVETLPGESYWIALTNPGVTPDASASFQIAGTSAFTFVPTPVTRTPVTAPLSPVGGAPIQLRLDSLAAAATAHRRRLEADAALVRRLGSPGRQWALARAAPAGPARDIGARIGDTVRIHVPNIDRPDFCSSYASINARQVYSGTHAQIFEDMASPLAGQMDSAFAAAGREYDSLDYGILLANFGDPLLLDTLLNRVGKVTMVFSPTVNQFGVLGFVTACDFYPESVAPSSNATETFYGPVPTDAGSGYAANTADLWKWEIRSTLIHESKHIVSYAARLAHNAPFEETWLEESSAVVAQELYSRHFAGNTWKGNANYASTLYCEVRPSVPYCGGRPYSMFNAFAFLSDYAGASELHSPLGPTTFSDATFYGSGWSLLRWAIDQTGGSEAQVLKSLTQEPMLTGVANLEARVGRSFTQMSADWQLALRSDGLNGFSPQDGAITLASWNLRDIYAGMNSDFPSQFSSFPEMTRVESVPQFQETVNALPGGTSVVLYPLSIGSGGFVLQVQGANGGAPPPLQIEILRFQ